LDCDLLGQTVVSALGMALGSLYRHVTSFHSSNSIRVLFQQRLSHISMAAHDNQSSHGRILSLNLINLRQTNSSLGSGSILCFRFEPDLCAFGSQKWTWGDSVELASGCQLIQDNKMSRAWLHPSTTDARLLDLEWGTNTEREREIKRRLRER
jgi:hypothetical protein